MADDEGEDIRGEVVAFWRRVYRKVDARARAVLTDTLGQGWRGGRLDARYISYFTYFLGAAADALGKTQTSKQRFPDGHTLDTYAAISALTAPANAPTLTHSAAGTTLTAGTYTLCICWDTPAGQTLLSPPASIAISAGDKIHVAANDALPAGASGMSVYQITTVPDPGYSPALYS